MSEAAKDGLLVSQGGGGVADGFPNRIVTSELPNVFHKNLQASNCRAKVNATDDARVSI
jgi:hypothetical protein